MRFTRHSMLLHIPSSTIHTSTNTFIRKPVSTINSSHSLIMATLRTALPRSLTLSRNLIRPTPLRLTAPLPRQFTTCRILQNTNKMASTKAQESSPSLEEKLTTLNGFLDKHKFVLLTSRAPDGSLHARTMAIADKTKDMRVRFIYDRDSYKETEIDNE